MASTRRPTGKRRQPATISPQQEIRAELRKAGVGFLWVLAACLMFLAALAADASRPIWVLTGLGVLAAVAVFSWHLTWAMRLWIFDDGEHLSPRQRRFKLLLAGVTTLGVSILLVRSALLGLADGVAPALSRHREPIPLETSPWLFWLSISLHLAPALIFVGLILWRLYHCVLKKMRQARE